PLPATKLNGTPESNPAGRLRSHKDAIKQPPSGAPGNKPATRTQKQQSIQTPCFKACGSVAYPDHRGASVQSSSVSAKGMMPTRQDKNQISEDHGEIGEVQDRFGRQA
ncbi:hypothetical protein, partial [Mesorhizobium sp.]|uniref:hypothetical protein n=1 Tax=Mesorhizobium sp. TaxID=1871066 RepID=UPI0025C11536